jgi:hypothetical protein
MTELVFLLFEIICLILEISISKWKEAVQKSMFRMNPGESPNSPSATDHIKKKRCVGGRVYNPEDTF